MRATLACKPASSLNRLIRAEGLEVLNNADMVRTLEVKQNNLREENHVHQLTVSGVRRSWLPLSLHGLLRGPRVFQSRPAPRKVSLSRLRFGGGPWPGTQGTL